jgi:hypothetical protein
VVAVWLASAIRMVHPLTGKTFARADPATAS